MLNGEDEVNRIHRDEVYRYTTVRVFKKAFPATLFDLKNPKKIVKTVVISCVLV